MRRNMRINRYLLIAMLLGFIILKLYSSCHAISARTDISDLADNSDLVIVGNVGKYIPMREHKTDNSGKIISLVMEGPAYPIKVEEVFYSKDPILEQEKEIYYIQKNLSTEAAFLLQNKKYILFLKLDPQDIRTIKKYSLPEGKYFSVVEGRQGERDYSDSVYIEAIRKFFSIRNLNNKNDRIREWEKLLTSSNLELKIAAEIELKKIGYKLEEQVN